MENGVILWMNLLNELNECIELNEWIGKLGYTVNEFTDMENLTCVAIATTLIAQKQSRVHMIGNY